MKFLVEEGLWWLVFEFYFMIGILILCVFGVIYNKKIISLNKKLLDIVVKLSILLLFWLLIVAKETNIEGYLFNYEIKKDNLNLFIIVLILIGGLISLVISLDYIKKDIIDGFEYALLVLLSIFGMVVITTSNDFLILYLGIELQSLCLYVLAAYKENSLYSTEAGLKYFVLGSFSSGILLFGIGLVYGLTGLISYSDLNLFFYSMDVGVTGGLQVGLILILIGLLFKVGAVPFHVWLPDVYAGSPVIVTGFFSIVPKIALFFLIAKFSFFIFPKILLDMNYLIMVSGLLSIIVGSLGALNQKMIKRLIAYSAISHTGFILLGLGYNSLENFQGILLYILIYVMMLINLFGIVLSLRRYSNYDSVRSLDLFANLYRNNKLLGIMLSISLFSLAGIPPLVGFFSKLYIFLGLVKGNYILVSMLGILLSVIGVVYYIRLVKVLFFSDKELYGFYMPVSKYNSIVIVYSGLFIVLFSIYSVYFINNIHLLVLSYYF